ncbi:MAG: segregation/condensation protein A [Okeania sp. SIO2D1]|nr:segregation/condensation protein A [Okeania sp. SIO2D1]
MFSLNSPMIIKSTQDTYQDSVEEAISVLVDLAQKGEIDPWDVKVIDVIDRYLSKFALTAEPELGKPEADLSKSGQAFLWASMLVLLKADTLYRWEEQEEELETIEEELSQPGEQLSLPIKLENHIRRRPTAPPPRQRRVTLTEFIEQIKDIASTLEENSSSSPSPRTSRHSRKEAKRLITQLAHNENLTEIAAQLEQFLDLHSPKLSGEQGWLELEQLLHWWSENSISSTSEHSSKSSERVAIFWGLLLLSSQSKVELHQEEFYQDLKIKLPCQKGI